MWREGVWCQKLQPTGELGRLFEVAQPRDKTTQSVAGEEGSMQRALEASFAQSALVMGKAQQDTHAQVQSDDNRFVWHQWLQRTRWARHLAGLDRAWLQQQLCRPTDSEPALEKVCWAVEKIIWKAQQASSPEVVGLPAATFIERCETGAPDNKKPFNAL